jgi:hypothetical protein
MEVDPRYQQTPDALQSIYVPSKSGTLVPLSSFSHFGPSNTPLAVNHQAQFPSVTISFNLAEGVSLGDATQLIEKTNRELNLPTSIHASFQGTAAAFQDSLSSEPILILAALGAVYIVLGILYESYIHPITILSTLPSAGVGALLALLLTHNDLNVIALIGVLLLIGIVKKNAIMMIDFALEAERRDNKSPEEAIYQFRAASSFGYHDCRRLDCEPDAYPLHNAGRLSLHGSHAVAFQRHDRKIQDRHAVAAHLGGSHARRKIQKYGSASWSAHLSKSSPAVYRSSYSVGLVAVSEISFAAILVVHL